MQFEQFLLGVTKVYLNGINELFLKPSVDMKISRMYWRTFFIQNKLKKTLSEDSCVDHRSTDHRSAILEGALDNRLF